MRIFLKKYLTNDKIYSELNKGKLKFMDIILNVNTRKIFFYILFIFLSGGIMAEDDMVLYISQLGNFAGKPVNDVGINIFLEKFPDADIVVINFLDEGNFNCIKIDREISTKYIGNYIGEVKRTGIQNKWQTWDATKLKVGTKLYNHSEWPYGKEEILVAVQNGQYIPYLIVCHRYE